MWQRGNATPRFSNNSPSLVQIDGCAHELAVANRASTNSRSVAMKILNAALSGFVASSLIAAPIAAQAAPVADRSASAVKGDQLAGLGWGWIFAVLVAIGVILIVVSDSDETAPHSP
jgi:hypothetical protein